MSVEDVRYYYEIKMNGDYTTTVKLNIVKHEDRAKFWKENPDAKEIPQDRYNKLLFFIKSIK